MASVAFECDICNEKYDTVTHKPLFLSCGHTFCRGCLLLLRPDSGKKCPSCREPLAQPVDELPVNFALLSPDKSGTDISNTSSHPCKDHRLGLDHLCLDCSDVVCPHCRLTTHRSHATQPFTDITAKEDGEEARKLFSDVIKGKLKSLTHSLLIPLEMIESIQELKTYIEGLQDSLLTSQTSVQQNLEAWNKLPLSVHKEETIVEIVLRLKQLEVSQKEKLPSLKLQLAELENKFSKLELLLDPFSPKSSNTYSSPPLNTSNGRGSAQNLLPHGGHWQVIGQASAQLAVASARAGNRPQCVTLQSSPSNPIQDLPDVLRVVGKACVGKIDLLLKDSFWSRNAKPNQRMMTCIEKYGHMIERFWGSPQEAAVLCLARSNSTLYLRVRLASLEDVEMCGNLSHKPVGVACIKELPPSASTLVLGQRWGPSEWHFPDLGDNDVDWVASLLGPFVPHLRQVSVSLYMPRCGLSEAAFRDLLKRVSNVGNATVLHCETVLLTTHARERLEAKAVKRGLVLKWEILF